MAVFPTHVLPALSLVGILILPKSLAGFAHASPSRTKCTVSTIEELVADLASPECAVGVQAATAADLSAVTAATATIAGLDRALQTTISAAISLHFSSASAELCGFIAAHATTITELDLSQNPVVSRDGVRSCGDAAARALSNLNSITLERLNLLNTGLSNAGVQALSDALEGTGQQGAALRHLNLAYNDRITPGVGAVLSKVMRCAPSLVHLDVSHLDLQDQGLAAMLRHGASDLVSIVLASTKLKGPGLQALTAAALPRLERLALSRNPIGAAGLEHLPRVVSALPGLKWLDLTDCGLGDAGARLVLEAVTEAEHNMVLAMALNGVTDAGIGRITSGQLKFRLTGLDLSYNALSEASATTLISAAEANPTVTHISLQRQQRALSDHLLKRVAVLNAARKSKPARDEVRAVRINFDPQNPAALSEVLRQVVGEQREIKADHRGREADQQEPGPHPSTAQPLRVAPGPRSAEEAAEMAAEMAAVMAGSGESTSPQGRPGSSLEGPLEHGEPHGLQKKAATVCSQPDRPSLDAVLNDEVKTRVDESCDAGNADLACEEEIEPPARADGTVTVDGVMERELAAFLLQNRLGNLVQPLKAAGLVSVAALREQVVSPTLGCISGLDRTSTRRLKIMLAKLGG